MASGFAECCTSVIADVLAALQAVHVTLAQLCLIIGVCNLIAMVLIARTMPANGLRDFLTTILRALYRMEVKGADYGGGPDALGMGPPGKPFFWIGDDGKACAGVHVAFTAATRAQVDSFYRAALNAGGKDHGAPGVRPHYHENY